MQSEPPRARIRHNVVLFGETGAGKSSIINMLQDSANAPVSSRASGCTLSSAPYKGSIGDQMYTFWDTAGLNETDLAKMPDMHAVAALYDLLRKLEGGVSLLVFCMQKPKATWDTAKRNWELFKHIICQDKVPVAIAVTHLEQEDMDVWWAENLQVFADHGVVPTNQVCRVYEETHPGHRGLEANGRLGQPASDTGVACVTATKGKLCNNGRFMLQEEYDQSVWKVRRLIYESHLGEPWQVEGVVWFQEVERRVRIGHWLCPRYVDVIDSIPGRGVYSLMERWRLTVEEAKGIVEVLTGKGSLAC